MLATKLRHPKHSRYKPPNTQCQDCRRPIKLETHSTNSQRNTAWPSRWLHKSIMIPNTGLHSCLPTIMALTTACFMSSVTHNTSKSETFYHMINQFSIVPYVGRICRLCKIRILVSIHQSHSTFKKGVSTKTRWYLVA